MKTKQSTQQTIDDRLKSKIPITDIFDVEKDSIDDICDRLWHEIFDPVEPNLKSIKSFLIDQYNIIAELINKNAGFKRVVTLNSSVIAPNDKMNNPNIKQPIYVECKMYPEVNMSFGTKTELEASVNKKQRNKKKTLIDVAMDDGITGLKDEIDEVFGESETPVIQMKPKKSKAEKQASLKPTGKKQKHVPKYPTEKKKGNKSNQIADLFAKGKTKDQIMEITGFTRKACTDAIWRYEQSLKKTKKK